MKKLSTLTLLLLTSSALAHSGENASGLSAGLLLG